jgi:hypothetical protein
MTEFSEVNKIDLRNCKQFDGITDTEDALLDDVGAEAASVLESIEHACFGEPFQILARGTRANAAEDSGADAKKSVLQVGQIHARSDKVAAAAPFTQIDAVFSVDGLQYFFRDERYRSPCARPARETAAPQKVTVAFQPATRNGPDLGDAC